MSARSQLKLHWHSFLLPHGREISDFMCHIFYMSCLPVLLVARGVDDLPKFIMSQIQAPVRCRPVFLPTTVCVSKLRKKTGLWKCWKGFQQGLDSSPGCFIVEGWPPPPPQKSKLKPFLLTPFRISLTSVSLLLSTSPLLSTSTILFCACWLTMEMLLITKYSCFVLQTFPLDPLLVT